MDLKGFSGMVDKLNLKHELVYPHRDYEVQC